MLGTVLIIGFLVFVAYLIEKETNIFSKLWEFIKDHSGDVDL